jgi:hypothetical protein
MGDGILEFITELQPLWALPVLSARLVLTEWVWILIVDRNDHGLTHHNLPHTN